MQKLPRKEFCPSDAPITKVVVYQDRADISRVLRLTATPGQQEVVLANIPTLIDVASLRVEGRGPAIVTEVNVSDAYVNKSHEPSSDQKEKRLRQAVEALTQQKVIEEHDEARLEKQQGFWNGCIDSLAKNAFTAHEGKSSAQLAASTEIADSFSGFLDIHARKSKELDQKLREKKGVVKKITEEIQTAKRNLQEFCNPLSDRLRWNIVVGLNVTVAAELELTISYIANNAKWSPKYDVRVSEEEKKLEISYYGIITQNTGEDWVNIPLSLSTAMPSSGGEIPVLGTRQLSFKIPAQTLVKQSHGGGFGSRPMNFGYPQMQMQQQMQQQMPMEAMQDIMSTKMASSSANVVQDSGITTTFEIAKQTSVPSDGSDHKVTVGVINLKPKIEYKCVPKKLQQAFLVAKAVNKSQYPILSGPANIFFGSNFVATVKLTTVSPMETFCCSLGVDPAVKVRYRPVRRLKEQTGGITKTNSISYVQEVEINNTRSNALHIGLIAQIPYSTEEHLIITVTEPDLTKDKADMNGYKLNKDNNVEHEADIKEQSVYVWTIKYKVEYPLDKEIEETELYGIEY